MKIADLLTPEHTFCNIDGVSKKRVLENLSLFLNDEEDYSGADADAIYQKLLERERLGSTGIGSGVAVPHGLSQVTIAAHDSVHGHGGIEMTVVLPE